ncbi:hypothetical protein ACWDCL_24285 [Streptomyces sp. NPDC001009]
MNRPGVLMSWLVVLVLGTVLASACDPGGAHPASKGGGPQGAHGAPVLAFVRPLAREIMLADADGRTWRGARSNAATDYVRWSPDGSALAWIDNENDPRSHDGRRLHRLDIATGHEQKIPCACHGVGFLGAEVATLTSDGDALLLVGAGRGARRVPLRNPVGDYAKLAAGGRDTVTVADPLPEQEAGRGQYQLLAVDGSGTVRPFLPARMPTSMVEGLQSPDGRRIAWSSADSGGACWIHGNALLATYGRKGRQAPARPADAAMTRALLKERVLVTGLAWAGDGLTVTFGPLQGCQAVPPARFVSYYLHDGKWRFIGTGMRAVGYGGQGRSARILVTTRALPRTDEEFYLPVLGDLEFTDRHHERHALGSGVSEFAFTPAESARAPAPAAAEEPRASGVVGTTDRGEPVPAHLRALAQRIKDAAENDDPARLRALCGYCDDETKTAIGTAKGRRELVKLLSSHPGRKENGIVFPGLAAHRCVDEPGQNITCTAEQLADIALLGIPTTDSTDLETYTGQVYEPSLEGRLQLRSGSGGKALWVGRYEP